MTWYHGGPMIKGKRLDPQHDDKTRSGTRDGYVYVTTNRNLAASYAASAEGHAFVHVVDPDHEPEPDPGSSLDYSFRCTGANVICRISVSNRERKRRRQWIEAML